MDPILAELTRGFSPTGDLRCDAPAFLQLHGCPKTAQHSAEVAAESRRVAALAGVDEEQAEAAGWLHDISAVFPGPDRVLVARALGVHVLPEEERYPPIIHQKLSAVVAREIFGVRDEAVLSAVGCHTTLKADASRLDHVLFVADKIAWDQPGAPPYLAELKSALDRSLEEASRVYLRHLWEMRDRLKVLHPWARDAYVQLCGLAFIELHLPECTAAIVGGSVLRGEGTVTSDLDIVILSDRVGVPFRESYLAFGWPVEAFVHTRESFLEFCAREVQGRRPSLALMCAEGLSLRNRGGGADWLRAESGRILAQGPARLTEAEVNQRRYGLTDLLDDFVGSTRPEETGFLAHDLAAAAADLILAHQGQWVGRGKWVTRALRRFDPTLAYELAQALEAFRLTGAKEPLIRFADGALAPVGGRLFDGFSSRKMEEEEQ